MDLDLLARPGRDHGQHPLQPGARHESPPDPGSPPPEPQAAPKLEGEVFDRDGFKSKHKTPQCAFAKFAIALETARVQVRRFLRHDALLAPRPGHPSPRARASQHPYAFGHWTGSPLVLSLAGARGVSRCRFSRRVDALYHNQGHKIAMDGVEGSRSTWTSATLTNSGGRAGVTVWTRARSTLFVGWEPWAWRLECPDTVRPSYFISLCSARCRQGPFTRHRWIDTLALLLWSRQHK